MTAVGETTVEDLLAEVAPRVITARVLLRQDLLDQHAVLQHALEVAVQADRGRGEGALDEEPEATIIAAQLTELEAEIDAAKRDFVFRRVGKKAWADLLAAHPPTKEQRSANPRIDNNPETFPLAAIAASCTSPRMTVEQAQKFEEILDLTQFQQIYQACLDANIGGGDSPKSALAGGIARANAQLGLQRTTIGPLDLSSLDGLSAPASGDPATPAPTAN